jgi:hypothetical protein
MAVSPDARTLRLLGALKCTAADLELNRRGQLSPDQRARLDKLGGQVRANTRWTFMLLSLCFGGCALYTLFFTPDGTRLLAAYQQFPALACAGLVMLAWFGLGLAWTAMENRRFAARLTDAPVAEVAGPVRLRLGRYGRGGRRAYLVQIERRVFYVEKQVYEAVDAGAAYRLYFAGGSALPILVAGESIMDNDRGKI